VECAVETSDGTKVPDVAWISSGRYAPHRRKFTLPIAPEICIGVISAGNTRAEMAGKRALYFDLDAREVWFCDDAGRLTFFVRGSSRPLRKSRLCPSFPARIGCD
jgi:Uma2 family endonuclease